MKTTGHILLSAIFAATLSLGSCVVDSQMLKEPYALVQVEMTESDSPVTRAGETMKTIRIFVFSGTASSPEAEINKAYINESSSPDIYPDHERFSVVDGKVRFVLEVKKRENPAENGKLIVAVINEPESMTATLDGITAPAQLEDLDIQLSEFVNADHLSLKNDVAIPMTGALWTTNEELCRTEAEAQGRSLTLEVHRAVARVDVYLKRGADVDPDMKMTTASTVKLNKTYTESNFLNHADGENTIGTVQTVTSGFVTKTWQPASERAIEENVLLCSFYTPERTHTVDADRLSLDIEVITNEGASRNGQLKITSAYSQEEMQKPAPDRIATPVNTVRRNHIYKVVATVGANGITGEVEEWEERPVNTEF